MEPSSGFYWDPVLVLDFKGWEPIRGDGWDIDGLCLLYKENLVKIMKIQENIHNLGLKFSNPACCIAARHVSIIDRAELKFFFRIEGVAGKEWSNSLISGLVAVVGMYSRSSWIQTVQIGWVLHSFTVKLCKWLQFLEYFGLFSWRFVAKVAHNLSFDTCLGHSRPPIIRDRFGLS